MNPSQAQGRENLPSHYPSSPRTVLIAEDDELLARSLSADLAELGYRVIGPTNNRQTAIDLARVERPDLALLEIRMPGLDGLVVAETLQIEINTPVIMLGGYNNPSYLQAAARLGVFGFLLEPVSMKSLHVAITVAWGRFLQHIRLCNEIIDLKTKLEQRKIIEKAKGILMKTMGISEEAAMDFLQRQARDTRRPMVELARMTINNQGTDKKSDV